MDAMQISEYARALYRRQGPAAAAEAARRARDSEAKGQQQEAAEWQTIRDLIHDMRGPRQG
ncbi:hypothetical protein [Roseivivax isoporae]|uniref:Uncharacterized protein n=1 Tax=Roseivivax isoporae LMG 25204 TaxID=1449351 RepID=X7FBQ4_9RHOB|nr:hypothetical protein [Roseivivax isoporae]ETX30153.1 hypothetical protein RISW2_18365 [Roseivivax isoporae LMG 25204]